MSEYTVQEMRWLEAIDDASIGVWDLDPRLESVHYAPAWKARLGMPRIDAPDSTAFWRCRVHPDDLEPMLRALRAHLDGSADSYTMQFRLRVNGAGYRTVRSRGRAVARDAQGNATRMVGTMVDLNGRLLPAPHGLPDDGTWHGRVAGPLPFHAALARRDGIVEQVDDLLDLALRDIGTAPCRLRSG